MQPLYMCLLFFNVEFPKKLNFPEGMGRGLNYICERSGGEGGGYRFLEKNGKSGELRVP